MPLDVVALVVVVTDLDCADLDCAKLRMRLDVVALVVVVTNLDCADLDCADLDCARVRAVVLMAFDVLLLVDAILWPIFHLNASCFEFLNLHTRRSLRPKSSPRRFKNANAADILRA
jgi:hypothetical protein